MQRVALIGAGLMGRRHADAYAQIADAEIVAICDERILAAEELASTTGAKAFGDLKSLLSEVEVDVFDVCTPTNLHLPYIRDAAKHRKHVIVEKPLARNIKDACDAVDLCEEAGVKLFTAQAVRWFPDYRRLRELVVTEEVGKPVIARTMRAGRFLGGWFGDLKASGGVVLDLAVHDFDFLRWCFGDVARVYARGMSHNTITDIDHALISLRFENGVIAHVEASWAQKAGFEHYAEIACTHGLLSLDGSCTQSVRVQAKNDDGTVYEISEAPSDQRGVVLELTHFIACIEGKAKPIMDPEDGLEAVRIAEAALQSIKTAKPVLLAQR